MVGLPSRADESIVPHFTTGLHLADDGVWETETASQVSYPDDGNAACAEIEDSSFWFRHRNRVIAALLGRYPPPGLPVFDLGGGNGYVSLGLRDAGFETVLVEPGRSGAHTATRRGVKHVISATVETAGFRQGALPAAGLFDVLEHVEDHRGFLQSIRSAMRSDGRLYLTVPAFESLWSNEDDHAGHFRRYTVSTLRAVLASAGFRVEYISYFFAMLIPAVFGLRTIPTLLGIRRPPSATSWRREHAAGSTRSNRVLSLMLDFEVNRVRRGLRLPIGTSCLCVALAD